MQIFDINVKAAALLVKEAHPHLKASGLVEVKQTPVITLNVCMHVC